MTRSSIQRAGVSVDPDRRVWRCVWQHVEPDVPDPQRGGAGSAWDAQAAHARASCRLAAIGRDLIPGLAHLCGPVLSQSRTGELHGAPAPRGGGDDPPSLAGETQQGTPPWHTQYARHDRVQTRRVGVQSVRSCWCSSPAGRTPEETEAEIRFKPSRHAQSYTNYALRITCTSCQLLAQLHLAQSCHSAILRPFGRLRSAAICGTCYFLRNMLLSRRPGLA